VTRQHKDRRLHQHETIILKLIPDQTAMQQTSEADLGHLDSDGGTAACHVVVGSRPTAREEGVVACMAVVAAGRHVAY
jgi:hypothetical protein